MIKMFQARRQEQFCFFMSGNCSGLKLHVIICPGTNFPLPFHHLELKCAVCWRVSAVPNSQHQQPDCLLVRTLLAQADRQMVQSLALEPSQS